MMTDPEQLIDLAGRARRAQQAVDDITTATAVGFDDYVAGEAAVLARTLSRVRSDAHVVMNADWAEPNGTRWRLTLERNPTPDSDDDPDREWDPDCGDGDDD